MSKKDEVRYYRSITDDFTLSENQDYKLPPNYQWVRNDFISKIRSKITYGAAVIFSEIYCRVFLHVRFKNRKVFKTALKTGAFIYGNHTQPLGDVFDPILACIPGRAYAIASPANLGIPFLGRILPYLGALPIPDSIHLMGKFNEAIETRLNEKSFIVIYPEAHVWEYYTKIREFPLTSFKYPIKYAKPSFAMTATYQKKRFGTKPRMTIYIDGPFYPDPDLHEKKSAEKLHNEIFNCMQKRSQESTYEYYHYEQEN